MKIRLFLALVALGLCGLIAYAFYSSTENNYITIVAGVMALLSLVPAMSLYFEGRKRMTVMFRTAACVMFFLFLVLNIVLAAFGAKESVTVVLNGVGLAVEAITLYGIYNAAIKDDLL